MAVDDLNEKLTRLLSDPEGMAKIQATLSALGGGDATPKPPPQPEHPLPDLSGIGRLMPLLSGIGQDTPDTRLLYALRPYLHGQRAQRLDEAVHLLKLAHLLPLLQEQGILNGMGGDNHGG